jgi:hypothetical protein
MATPHGGRSLGYTCRRRPRSPAAVFLTRCGLHPCAAAFKSMLILGAARRRAPSAFLGNVDLGPSEPRALSNNAIEPRLDPLPDHRACSSLHAAEAQGATGSAAIRRLATCARPRIDLWARWSNRRKSRHRDQRPRGRTFKPRKIPGAFRELSNTTRAVTNKPVARPLATWLEVIEPASRHFSAS